MAVFALTDALIWVHDQDVTGSSNKLSLKISAEDLDATVFGGGGWKRRIGGLHDVELSVDGYADSAAGPDTAASAALGVADRAYTVAASGTAGSVAYLFQAGQLEYEQFGSVGDLAPFTLDSKGTNRWPTVRGQLAKTKGVVSTTGAIGSAVQLGAGGAGKFLYATVHVFSAGTTVTVQVQSDNSSGMSSPTTVATIGPLTAAGGTFMTRVDASSITDDWFRLNVSAITGSFTLGGAVAVQ